MKDFAQRRQEAIDDLKGQRILRDARIIRAMLNVPREEFLPPDARSLAYVDSPIPIGYGQTTSALHMTALFCEYGEMKLGQRVLEVGGGCGYMSCVYAEVVASNDQRREQWGHVWSAEIIPELAEFGAANVKRLGYSDRVTFLAADASVGLREAGSFDLIITTSAAPEAPKELVDQLNPGGTLMIPIGNATFYQELVRIRKDETGQVSQENLGGVVFVPMRGKHGWR